MSSSSYPRSDRPTLQRRPLTAPAPIRPPLCATATATTVLKPHPLRRAVSHSTATLEEDDAEGSVDDAAAAAEELREIVANLSLRQQQRRPPPDTDSHYTAAAAVAVRRSSPSNSSSYLNRALPRTPSRGSRNGGGGGVGVPLKRKASLGGGGACSSSVVPESALMQVESTAGTGDEVESLWATPRNDNGRRRDTPPWIGLDGKRCEP